MNYIKTLIGVLLAIAPLFFVISVQTDESEEAIKNQNQARLTTISHDLQKELKNYHQNMLRALNTLNNSKDNAQALQEYYHLVLNKKPSTTQSARIEALQKYFANEFEVLTGLDLKLTLVNSVGQIISAQENGPYPQDINIAHTSFFKDVRSGYERDGLELNYDNAPTMMVAAPIMTKDGLLIVILSQNLDSLVEKVLSHQDNKDNLNWAITISDQVALSNSKDLEAASPKVGNGLQVYSTKDAVASIPILGSITGTPIFLKEPELCGLQSVGQYLSGNISKLAVHFVLDASVSYSTILRNQIIVMFAATLIAIVFILFALISRLMIAHDIERLCDHLSLILKGNKANSDLSPSAFAHYLKRLIVLLNKFIAQNNGGTDGGLRNLLPAVNPVIGGSAIDAVLSVKEEPLPSTEEVINIPLPMGQSITNSSRRATLSEESTIPGIESALDSNLINQITDDLEDLQDQQAAATPDNIASVPEMLNALDALESFGEKASTSSLDRRLTIPDLQPIQPEATKPEPKKAEPDFSMPPLSLPDDPMDLSALPDFSNFDQSKPVDHTNSFERLDATPQAPISRNDTATAMAPIPLDLLKQATNAAKTAPASTPSQEATRISPIPLNTLMGITNNNNVVAESRQTTAQAATVVAPNPFLAAAATQNDAGEDDTFRAVFENYKQVRQECGESIAELNFQKFAQKLRSTKAQVMSTQGCKDVRFQVHARNGKAALKAIPVK